MSNPTTARRALTIAVVIAGLATGCGSSDGDAEAEAAAPPTTVAPVTTVTTTTVPVSAGTYASDVSVTALDVEAPEFLTSSGDAVWVAHHRAHAVSRVDPVTGQVEATIAIDPEPGSTQATDVAPAAPGTGSGSVLATEAVVWVLDLGGFAWAIDPATDEIVDRIDQPGLRAESGLAITDEHLWTLTASGVNRADLADGSVTSQALEQPGVFNGPQVVATDDAVWMASLGGTLRVDPETLAVERTVEVGPTPLGHARDLIWGIAGAEVVGLDPATGAVRERIASPAGVGGLRADSATLAGDSIWVVAGPPGERLGRNHWFQLVHFDLTRAEADRRDLMNAEFDFIVGLTVADGDLWATDYARGNLLRYEVEPTV